jgi:hypothetical protein
VIDLYLKDSAFISEVVFIVPSRHEWFAALVGLDWGGEEKMPAASKYDADKPGGA